MAGINQLIGTGQAQVLPQGNSLNSLVQQLNEQKQLKIRNDRYDQAKKEQDQKELYGLVGDALNLKDFNSVIHDKVKKAQIELAQKIKAEKPSYADTYIMAQNKAAELGQTSQALNQADQVIAATKKEYEPDKRINAANIEMIARKKILDDLNKNGKVDPNKNYFDEALNEYPQYALTDNSDFTITDFIPEEKQSLFGKYKETNKRGATDQFDWKADTYPVYYDFKDNGEEKSPTITTRSQPSGLKDENQQDIPMLADEAYGRFKAKPSNIVAINRRLQNQYGNALDLKSSEAETLRKIEAYKDVDRQKPRVNSARVAKEAHAPRISIHTGSGGGQTTIRDVYQDVYDRTKRARDEGKPYLQTNLLEGDSQSVVLDEARKATGDSQLGYGDIKIILDKDDKLGIYDATNNQLIKYLTKVGTNVKAQPSVKEKREVIKQGEPKPKTEDFRKKYNY